MSHHPKRKAPAPDQRPDLRCPWCSRHPVQFKRGRLMPHVTPGNRPCVGVGQHYSQALFDRRRPA